MTREQLDAIRARVDDGFPPPSSLDIALLLAEVERLRRELDKATDDHIESQRNGAREAIARKAAEAEVERLQKTIDAVGEVISKNGEDCDCDCIAYGEPHGPDCDPCLACRVSAALGE